MLSVSLALVAALLFALGTVLQQRVAMTVPDAAAHSAWFMLRLVRHPVWVAGIAATLIGFVFHAAALAGGEIVIVQPILSLTMVLALPLGARLSAQRVSRSDGIAAVGATVGLAAFLVLSNPSAGRDDAPIAQWAIAGGGLVAISAALTGAGLHRRPAVKATLIGSAAGILFGLHGALVKGMVTQFDHGLLGPLQSWELYAVAVGAWVSMTISQIALQAGDLAPAIATESILAPIAGVALGVTLFQESLHDTTAGVVLSLAALAVMLACIAALSRSAASGAGPVPAWEHGRA
jgi:drug/metabolite transporter (DMT)-like permease